MLTASADLVDRLSRVQNNTLDTEKQPLVEWVIKKNTLAAKTFLLFAILFVVISGHSTDYLAQVRCI